ncbi:MAG: T9SS type A sorting domain-containing protein [Cytophagales bacterium]|nr:T9SS type A sorting domain-containing protein [Cytophagales bacterium]
MRKAFVALVITTVVAGSIYLNYQNSNGSIAQVESQPNEHTKLPRTDRPDLYIQLHEYLQTEAGADKPAYEFGYQLKEFAAAKIAASKKLIASRTEAVTWDEKGPGNVSGRTPGIWIDPSDASINTWVLGSAGGGIWRTTDGGATWSNRTNNLPNLRISLLAGSSANNDVIYAGTGRRFNAFNPSTGNGILKSTDGGQTWSVLESTLNDSKFANITGIAVNQTNENELVASTTTDTNSGGFGSFILKSVDGGASWDQVFLSGSRIQQIIAAPDNFNIQFASINSVQIIKSIDAGENWDTVFRQDSIHNEDQDFLRVEMAMAPTNNNRLYLAMEIDENDNPESELYMTGDQGASWSRVIGQGTANNFGNWLDRQGWYDNTIAVHPYIDTCVFVAGVSGILEITLADALNDSLRSGTLDVLIDANGQYNIEGVRQVGSKGVHVDHHHLTLLPINEATQEYYIFNGNDGGMALSKDQGETFTQTGAWVNFRTGGNFGTFSGYNSVEFYGVDKKNGEDRYVAGSQDNGSWVSGVDPGINSNWRLAPSGDGFFAAWHYTNPNLIIESAQNNAIWKSTDEGQSWDFINLPSEGGPFATEVENSKQDPDLVFMASPQGLVRSQDFGDNWEILPMPGTWQYNPSITRVAISLVNPDVVWSGASIGNGARIARSTNGGDNWAATEGYTEANRGPVTNINTHPADENTAYALFSQANGPKILRTTDGGDSWTDISGFNGNIQESTNGFPDVPTFTLLVMPFDHDIIWVGTAIGIVESLDGGETWALKTDHNLPAVSVWDMRIVNDEVVIATYGRGIWSATLPELEGYEPPAAFLSPLLTVDDLVFGSTVSGTSVLKSAYDSTRIIATSSRNVFDDIVIHEQMGNEAGDVVEWSIDLTTALANASGDQAIDIIHRSWSNGIEKTTDGTSRVVLLNEPATSFFNPIDGDIVGNFIIDGFAVSRSLSIEGNAFHSPHPYRGGGESYAFTVRTPFQLSADTAVLRYNDIAIVEPGDDFGEQFYDYVAIEAVKLPLETAEPEWIELIRYDSRQHADWLAAYNADANAAPSADLFKEQAIDLYESGDFQQGDQVLVRFLLQSDPFVEGYGWVVDNISFNTEPQIVLSTSLELGDQNFSVYPNPVQELASFTYQLDKASNVILDIYDLDGKRIKHMDLGFQNSGEHQYEFLTSGMEPGIYVSVLNIEASSQTLKWILGR